jgi:hypothetical protein
VINKGLNGRRVTIQNAVITGLEESNLTEGSYPISLSPRNHHFLMKHEMTGQEDITQYLA